MTELIKATSVQNLYYILKNSIQYLPKNNTQ